MKKFLFLLSCLLLLTACNDASDPKENASDKPSEATVIDTKDTLSEIKKAQQAPTESLTVEDAKRIHTNIFNSLRDAWFEEAAFQDPFESEDRDLYINNLLEHFSNVATSNYLSNSFRITLYNTCNDCHESAIFNSTLAFDKDIQLIITGKDTFDLSVYHPLDIYTNEATEVYHYAYVDKQWKYDGSTYQLIKEADGYTEGDSSNYVEPVYSQEMHNTEQLMQQLDEKYYNLMQNPPNLSLADIGNLKADLLEEFNSAILILEEKIEKVDSFYSINQSLYKEIIDKTVKNMETLTAGGSGQGTFMIEEELRLQKSRLSDLFYQYRQEL